MARPGVISRTSAVLASSHAVAAGSIASNLGSLRIGKEHKCRVSAELQKPHGSDRRRVASYGTEITPARVKSGQSAGLDEVLVRPRRGWAALTLVFGAGLG